MSLIINKGVRLKLKRMRKLSKLSKLSKIRNNNLLMTLEDSLIVIYIKSYEKNMYLIR